MAIALLDQTQTFLAAYQRLRRGKIEQIGRVDDERFGRIDLRRRAVCQIRQAGEPGAEHAAGQYFAHSCVGLDLGEPREPAVVPIGKASWWERVCSYEWNPAG